MSYQLTSLRNKSFFLSSLTRTHDAKELACSRRSGRGGWRDNESGRGNGGGGIEGEAEERESALSPNLWSGGPLPFFISFSPSVEKVERRQRSNDRK